MTEILLLILALLFVLLGWSLRGIFEETSTTTTTTTTRYTLNIPQELVDYIIEELKDD